jgi:hypothetical protein
MSYGIGDGDFFIESDDDYIVPGVYSIISHPVYRACGD